MYSGIPANTTDKHGEWYVVCAFTLSTLLTKSPLLGESNQTSGTNSIDSTSFSFSSLNYLSPFLPPNSSALVDQTCVEACSLCPSRIGSCCLWKSLRNCIFCSKARFYFSANTAVVLFSFSIELQHKRAPARFSFFFRIHNNLYNNSSGDKESRLTVLSYHQGLQLKYQSPSKKLIDLRELDSSL